jgi:hypothetical protein
MKASEKLKEAFDMIRPHINGHRTVIDKFIFAIRMVESLEDLSNQRTNEAVVSNANDKRFIVIPGSVTKQDFFSYTIVDTAAGKEDYGDYWKRSMCETLEEAEANEICEALNKYYQQD